MNKNGFLPIDIFIVGKGKVSVRRSQVSQKTGEDVISLINMKMNCTNALMISISASVY